MSTQIERNQLINLRGGVALVQHLREAPTSIEVPEISAKYILQEKISPVFYEYTRMGTHCSNTTQDIYVILPC